MWPSTAHFTSLASASPCVQQLGWRDTVSEGSGGLGLSTLTVGEGDGGRGPGEGEQGSETGRGLCTPCRGKEDEAGGRQPSLRKGRPLWESPHYLGACFKVTCLLEDERRNRKERADLTGKSSWTGDSSWLRLPLRPEPGLAAALHHMPCCLGAPSRAAAAPGVGAPEHNI